MEASLADQLRGAAALAALEKRGDLFTSPAEAARILKLDVRTVYGALERGQIPHTKIGQKYQIPVSWLRKQAGSR
jgi:excisionase family DNA binding protein